jgi:hypothetical protein
MKRLQIKLASWLLHRLNFKFVAIKQTATKHNVYAEIPTLFIEGDKELLKYIDTLGYLKGAEPLRRSYPENPESSVVQRLPAEVVAEIVANTEPFPEELKKQNETLD